MRILPRAFGPPLGGRAKDRRGAAITSEAKRREVLQLLKDYRAFKTPFGGARALDDQHVSDAAYGPAGYLEAGAEYERRDVKLLKESLGHLNRALRFVREYDYNAWASLIKPYLGDDADPGSVEAMREKVRELDQENARRRGAGKPDKPGLVFARLQLARHDRAVKQLAHHLRNVDLHVVHPRLMSTREQAAGDAANAQVKAYYERTRVAGRTHRGAIAATAVKFEISEDEVERIVEFAPSAKLATCAEPGCGDNVFQQNLCQKHYQREWRARKKVAGASG